MQFRALTVDESMGFLRFSADFAEICHDVASCALDSGVRLLTEDADPTLQNSSTFAMDEPWLVAGVHGCVMVKLDPVADDRREALDFVFHEGLLEIRCRVSYDALRRQAGVFEIDGSRARRLFNWYRSNFERIALARYSAGDFHHGIVTIGSDDIVAPADRR